ncbi:hypothetical protein GCM10017674_77140 [Streptomyces gardneri]|uniref:Lipoprotein n=3 Tax=Streptomyces gardneri TaxID=66892 RepID=A0A4Y3RTX3_9ACTN|nr:hypothetical protein SGA01_57880 [Streptomyces gardneri]GHH21880.1 hypothetical protein GCM10017674_77140 [Streptomyces gardneri]
MLLVTLAGCTSGTELPRDSAKPARTKSSATTRPAVTQRPYDKMPARPLGEAAVNDRDHAFLQEAFAIQIPAGHKVPPADEVAVIRRMDAKNGELAWMSDGRTFCYGKIREGYSSYSCGRLPEEAPAPGLLFTIWGEPDRVSNGENNAAVRVVSFVIAEGGPARFDHVKRSKETGPVHQAVARFPSGRMVTFLTFDRPYGPIDPEAEICRSDRKICFPSEDLPL